MRPVHILTPYFLSHILIFLCSLLCLGSPSACYMSCPLCPPWLDHLKSAKTRLLLLVLAGVQNTILVFWKVVPCHWVNKHCSFNRSLLFTYQYSIPTHKTWIFIVYSTLMSFAKMFVSFQVCRPHVHIPKVSWLNYMKAVRCSVVCCFHHISGTLIKCI